MSPPTKKKRVENVALEYYAKHKRPFSYEEIYSILQTQCPTAKNISRIQTAKCLSCNPIFKKVASRTVLANDGSKSELNQYVVREG